MLAAVETRHRRRDPRARPDASAARTWRCRSSGSRRCGPRAAPPLQRIGLSATQRPLDEVARLLGGFDDGDDRGRSPSSTPGRARSSTSSVEAVTPRRPTSIARRARRRRSGSRPHASGRGVHARVVELVRAHRSTIVFVNSRRLAERLAAALNERRPARRSRSPTTARSRARSATAIEERLKRGDLRAIVATSSLELGIDMGAVDLVVQIEAPPSVASGLQRIGRACHGVGGVPRGVLLPKHRARPPRLRRRHRRACAPGEVEETFYPRNPLDVLAQQIVAMASVERARGRRPLRSRAPRRAVRRAAAQRVRGRARHAERALPVRRLRRAAPAHHVGPRARARSRARRRAAPRDHQRRHHPRPRPLRRLPSPARADEQRRPARRRARRRDGLRAARGRGVPPRRVVVARRGDHARPRARDARRRRAGQDAVLARRPARARARLRRAHRRARARASPTGDAGAARAPRARTRSTPAAAETLVAYVREQVEATGEVPSDRTIVVERFVDELGDWRVVRPLPVRHARASRRGPSRSRRALRERVRRASTSTRPTTGSPSASRRATSRRPPSSSSRRPTRSRRWSPARSTGRRSSPRASASTPRARCSCRAAIPASARRSGRSASARPICSRSPRATRRSRSSSRRTASACATSSTCPASSTLLRRRRGAARPRDDRRHPRALAVRLERPLLVRRQLHLRRRRAARRAPRAGADHRLAPLRELLGEAELRELLDADVIAEHERWLQRLVATRATHADARARPAPRHRRSLAATELRDARARRRSRRDGVGARARARAGASSRVRDRRAGALRRGRGRGEAPRRARRGAAARAARARSSSRRDDPLRDLVSRYARTHGPFAATRRRGALRRSTPARVAPAIAELAARRAARRGRASCPRGTRRELCDREVLDALRRKSLARLRRAVEPVDAARARALPPRVARRHRARGAGATRSSPSSRELEGCPLVASALETAILPARLEGYRPWDLDALCASGEVVWAGVEPLGASDGRIALYLADHEPLLDRPAAPGRGRGRRGHPRAARAARRGLLRRDRARGRRLPGRRARRALGAGLGRRGDQRHARAAAQPRRGRLEPPSPRARSRVATPARAANRAPGSEGRWSLRVVADGGARRRPRPSAARRWRTRCSTATASSRARPRTPRASRAASPPSTTCSRRWRTRGACGAATSSRGAAARSSRCRAPTSGCAPLRDPVEGARPVVLAATDPANAWGALLDWPPAAGGGEARPQRAAGALVVLRDGALLGWLGRAAHALLTFRPDQEDAGAGTDAVTALAHALARWSMGATGERSSSRPWTGERRREPVAATFAGAGFAATARGLLKRRESAARSDDVEVTP